MNHTSKLGPCVLSFLWMWCWLWKWSGLTNTTQHNMASWLFPAARGLTFEQRKRRQLHLWALVAELRGAVGPSLAGPAHGPAGKAVHLLCTGHWKACGGRGWAGRRELSGGLHGCLQKPRLMLQGGRGGGKGGGRGGGEIRRMKNSSLSFSPGCWPKKVEDGGKEEKRASSKWNGGDGWMGGERKINRTGQGVDGGDSIVDSKLDSPRVCVYVCECVCVFLSRPEKTGRALKARASPRQWELQRAAYSPAGLLIEIRGSPCASAGEK